jgi:hypothetical protein
MIFPHTFLLTMNVLMAVMEAVAGCVSFSAMARQFRAISMLCGMKVNMKYQDIKSEGACLHESDSIALRLPARNGQKMS